MLRSLLVIAGLVLGKLEYINERKLGDLALSMPDGASLVLVKTQGCGELCETFEKSLDSVQSNMKDAKIKFYKTEIAHNAREEFMRKFGLLKVPTTLMIRGPWIYDYPGDLVTNKIAKFVSDHLRPIMLNVTDKDAYLKDFTQDKEDYSHFLVEAAEPGRQNFELVAGGELDFAKYAFKQQGDEKDADGKVNTRGKLSVTNWAVTDKPYVIENIDLADHANVYKTILAHHIPPFAMLDILKMRYYFLDSKSFGWLVATDEQFEKHRDLLARIAQQYGSTFHFIRLNPVVEPHHGAFVDQVLKLKDALGMNLVLTDIDGPGRFYYKSSWEADKLLNWVQQCLDGKAEKMLDSEPNMASNEARMSEFNVPKISANELQTVVVPDHASEWVLFVPSLLCEEQSCESAFVTINKYLEEHEETKNLQTLIDEKACLKIAMIDGRHNEIDNKWGFSLSDTPPLWLVQKAGAKTPIQDRQKVHLKPTDPKSPTYLAELLEQHSACVKAGLDRDEL